MAGSAFWSVREVPYYLLSSNRDFGTGPRGPHTIRLLSLGKPDVIMAEIKIAFEKHCQTCPSAKGPAQIKIRG